LDVKREAAVVGLSQPTEVIEFVEARRNAQVLRKSDLHVEEYHGEKEANRRLHDAIRSACV